MIWNATLGPISIVSGALQFGQLFRTSGNVAFVRKAMDEVCAIARAKGHTPFTSEVIDHRLALSRTIPGYKTSMAVDFENNLPIELEAILGNVVRAGRDVGVAIPILETLYALATMKQATRVEY
jgi:2-dehydropantoate 2-reductase